MAIEVKELRLSLVWKKYFSEDLLMPFISDSSRYKQEFKSARSKSSIWSLPWREEGYQHFWQYYLNLAKIGDFSKFQAEQAWNFLVPLRAPTWAKITPVGDACVSMEGYCFPHSVGAIATIYIRPEPPLPLDQMVGRVIEMRNYQYNLLWRDDQSEAHGSLDSLADRLIDRLHRLVLNDTPRGRPLSGPISIATVIDAAGAQAEPSRGKKGVPVDRAMFGLCNLKPNWERGKITGMIDSINGPYQPDDDPSVERLFGLEHGRAIWLPDYFTDALDYDIEREHPPRARRLGCYHRNLTMATLQTQSLTGLATRAYDFLPDRRISARISKPVKTAVKLLRDLYAGSLNTYRTWSLRYQISFNEKIIQDVGLAVGEIFPQPAEPES